MVVDGVWPGRGPRVAELGCLAAVVWAAGCHCGTDRGERDRAHARIDRPAVHFHLALRDRLEGEQGAAVGQLLARAPAEAPIAERIASETRARLGTGARRLREGAPPGPVLHRLGVPERLSPEADRAALLLGLIVEDARDDRVIPKQVLVYEALSVDADRAEPEVLRPLLAASIAMTHARAGNCDLAETYAASPAAISERALGDALAAREVADLSALQADLVDAHHVLALGARACCAMRDHENRHAATLVVSMIDATARLGVSPERQAILRAWVAIVRGELAEAEREMASIDIESLPDHDRARYRMLRSALAAADSAGGLVDATERLVDRRWLSQLVLAAVVSALERDGLWAALATEPRAIAGRRYARGLGAALAAARTSDPLFDHHDGASHPAKDRLGDLFGRR